jgi:hypothetical protein
MTTRPPTLDLVLFDEKTARGSPSEYNWNEKGSSQVNLLGSGAGSSREAEILFMMDQLKINCTRLGQRAIAGRHHMVAVDASPASWRALDVALRSMGPMDHLYVVHVRQLAQPVEAGYLLWSDCPDPTVQIRLDHSKWTRAREVARAFHAHLVQLQPPVNFSLLFPGAYDPRAEVCALAKQLGCSTLLIGRHAKEDKPYRMKNYRLRSFTYYCTHNTPKKCRVAVV